jgi:hypothetical protein
VHLVALPGGLAGSLAFGFWAVTLIFVPHTAFKHIPAATADNLFHGCHQSKMIEGWNEKRKESEGIIGKYLFDRGIKIKERKFWQHNQTAHIACLYRQLSYIWYMLYES